MFGGKTTEENLVFVVAVHKKKHTDYNKSLKKLEKLQFCHATQPGRSRLQFSSTFAVIMFMA